MPHHARPMTGLLLFTGVNLVLLNTITPVYDFVCFHPYWERRRERRQKERKALQANGVASQFGGCERKLFYYLVSWMKPWILH
ncbi:uncharacterized isoform X1 [Oryza sativa Japonica Group]|uniref:uncharacterized isoform X1 n=1 Tax=Oryza sativa subsp. japonica TaxID=39947 RepID=UPI000E1C39EA|nr:uncharacterized protein LOC112937446 isoform X1 [Oryza sativa Japonica Group]